MDNIRYYIFLVIIVITQLDYGKSQSCSDKIHRECLHTEPYTAAQIKVAEDYIINAFAKKNPNGKRCESLRIRKDFKCLNQTELDAFVDVFKKLVANGAVTNITIIHDKYWDAFHKTSEAVMDHRWIYNLLELAARKLPGHENFTLPYWEFYVEAYQPDKSIIWDTLGTPGPDGCIATGPFANLQVFHPNTHCLRRFWNISNIIDPWEPAEWLTSIMQMEFNLPLFTPYIAYLKSIFNFPLDLAASARIIKAFDSIYDDPNNPIPYSQFSIMLAYTNHFVTHLVLGGLKGNLSDYISGDLSTGYGTQDPAFYLFHNGHDYINLKKQLSYDKFLVPDTYDIGIRLDSKNKTFITNLEKDLVTYFNISVKDTFTVGWGELCYTFDQLIIPINNMVKNVPMPLPPVVQKLQSSLSPDLFAQYYPRFASGNATFFDYALPNVGDCNTGPNCNQIKYWQYFTDTLNGRVNAWHRFKDEAKLDITPIVGPAEKYAHDFRDNLNKKYCSPYAMP